MALQEKIKNAAEELTGKAKEAAGRQQHDGDLEAEGRQDQSKAKVKRVGEDVKDVFR